MTDTIIAVATATGECSINVLRLSGPEATDIIKRAFVPHNQARFDKNLNYTAYLGNFYRDGQLIDEVLVLRMLSPSSYTGEDVYEISCHGGFWVTEQIMRCCLTLGARLAEPGEYTKRAFLNGKLDLIQAEAIVDLINARTDSAAGLALSQLKGGLSGQILVLRREVLDLLSFIEAGIDFPEDDVEDLDRDQLKGKITLTLEKMNAALEGSKTGKILREGLVTVIVGLPNVGKSSLLNALLQEERAIVTDIPGTTRDEIRESVSIGGILLQLIDTAGIRESEDAVERLGIERTWKALKKADLILLVRQAGEPLAEEEERIIKEYSERTLVLENKIDLLAEYREVPPSGQEKRIPFSVLEHSGFAELEREIKDRVYRGQPADGHPAFLSNVRQIAALERARASLGEGLAALEEGMPWDILAIDVRKSLEEISQITGDNVQEDLLDNIFSRFCIGK